jgi:hypothetical protein
MSLLSIGADAIYTFRFLKLLVTPFNKTEAFKLGIIDKDGKRTDKKIESSKERSTFTTFHRLVFNLKKLIGTAPGGKTRLASYASALFLLKEHADLSDASIEKILAELGMEAIDLMEEHNDWFIIEGDTMSHGIYRLRDGNKMLKDTMTESANKNDQVRVANGKPVGDLFGINIYEATHIKTGKSLYITTAEVLK